MTTNVLAPPVAISVASNPASLNVTVSRVRLTRRGRCVVLLAALIITVLLAVVFASAVTATDSSGTAAEGAAQEIRTVTVRADQTLWHVAAAANPQGDIRDTVDEIVKINSLPAATVQPGTELAVPVYQ